MKRNFILQPLETQSGRPALCRAGKSRRGRIYLPQSKDPYHEEDDQIAIVLQLDNVFFEYAAYSRRVLAGQNVAEAGAQFLAVFHQIVERTMQEGQHLQLLFVRIYEELGLDAEPLIRYREEYRERLRQEDEEKNAAKRNSDGKPKNGSRSDCGKQGNGSSLGSLSPAKTLSAYANSCRFPYRFARMELCAGVWKNFP